MKHILNKKHLTLILVAAMMLVMALALSGCSSEKKAARPATAAPKAGFDDTEILKSPLLMRSAGNRWKLTGSVTYTTRKECLGCDVYLFSSDGKDPELPYMEVILMTTPVDRNDEVHADTLTALRVTVGSTCYSFGNLDMCGDGFARLPCGSTARAMLSDLAGCSRATFEVDYVQYGTGKKGTFTAVISRSGLSEWRKMAALLENSNIWGTRSSFYLSMDDEGTRIIRR